MAETGPKILVASAGESIDALRRRAQGETPRSGFGALAAELRNFTDTQADINQAMNARAISMEEFLRLSQKQIGEMLEATGRMDPEEERRRWVDVEFSQDFYTRFQPNQEPRFYTHLSTQEREVLDARWQLARAAFVKKATAAFPDKYRENQDLALLGKEQMERLYGVEGVKEMLSGYSSAIVGEEKGGRRVFKKYAVGEDGKTGRVIEKTFWDISDAGEFSRFRQSVREEQLKEKGLPPLAQKEADAVAWNLIWVSNLVESADSRYSYSGGQHRLPSVICAGEYRAALHQQEKYEDKCVSGHFWSAFGKWGVTQLERISTQVGMPKRDIEFRFRGARDRGSYWGHQILTGDDGKPEDSKKKCVVMVDAPECCPVTAGVSFWEQSKLLDPIIKGEAIKWDEVQQDAWSIYMMGKFHKTTALMEFFEPGKPMELQKPGGAYVWSNEILELFVRLGIDANYYRRLQGQDEKNPLPPGVERTHQSLNTLKSWLVYAAFDGVKDPTRRDPTFNRSLRDAAPVILALANKRVRYFNSVNDFKL